jgi:uncharacterized protein (DUF433 family)
MQLEEYFNFLAPNDIRLKDSRIGIETILYEYIYRTSTAEEIAQLYTNITLEQIYATILYYLHETEKVSQYMAEWLEYCLKSEQEQDENPPPFILRLRKLKAETEVGKPVLNEH